MSIKMSNITVHRAGQGATSPHGAQCPSVLYIPLPRDLWRQRPRNRSTGVRPSGYLDTLAVSMGTPSSGPDKTWMVHRPDLHVQGSAPVAPPPARRV